MSSIHNSDEYTYRNIPHVNVALKLKQRNEPLFNNTRIEYCFINDGNKIKKSEIAEDYNYVIRHKKSIKDTSSDNINKPIFKHSISMDFVDISGIIFFNQVMDNILISNVNCVVMNLSSSIITLLCILLRFEHLFIYSMNF